jgi:hypothetical protein
MKRVEAWHDPKEPYVGYELCSDAFYTADILCETWSEPCGVCRLQQYPPLDGSGKRLGSSESTVCKTAEGLPYAIRMSYVRRATHETRFVSADLCLQQSHRETAMGQV